MPACAALASSSASAGAMLKGEVGRQRGILAAGQAVEQGLALGLLAARLQPVDLERPTLHRLALAGDRHAADLGATGTEKVRIRS